MKRAVVILALLFLLAMHSCGGGGGGGSDGADFEFTAWEVFTKYGDWAARGLLKNISNDRAKFVQVCADLKNSSGAVIASDCDYINTSDLGLNPGQEAAFDLWAFNIVPSSVASYTRTVRFRR